MNRDEVKGVKAFPDGSVNDVVKVLISDGDANEAQGDKYDYPKRA